MVIDTAPRSRTAPLPPRRPSVATAALGLLVATVAGGALALVLAMRVLSLVTGSSMRTVDALLEVAVCGVGALVAAWLAVSALLALGCLAVRLVGSSWRGGERLVHRCAPAVVRRALVLMVGATVGLGSVTGASAVAPAPTPPPATVTADDLGWPVTTRADAESAGHGVLPTTTSAEPTATGPTAAVPPLVPVAEPVVDPPAAIAAAPSTPAPALAPAESEPVVVVAGDSLWAIAARHLAPDATDAEIAASWPQWYHANASVIGSDPGLVVPGQELAAPVVQDEAAS